MAGDETPPEVPEEFAAAYQEAYRRALGEGVPEEEPVTEYQAVPMTDPAAERVTEYRTATLVERILKRPGCAPLLAVLAVVLVLLLGWLLVGLVAGDDESAPAPADPGPSSAGSVPAPTTPTQSPSSGSYRGKVRPAAATKVTATCTLEPGTDAAGRRVSYEAARAVDDDASTAWRCEGDAVGERLVLVLPAGSEVAELGLVPGYAKTDPANGADRYAENNRITRVRWTLAPGVSFEQRLDPDPGRRELQSMRIPVTASTRVVLEILAVAQGSRGATAISDIRLSRPAG